MLLPTCHFTRMTTSTILVVYQETIFRHVFTSWWVMRCVYYVRCLYILVSIYTSWHSREGLLLMGLCQMCKISSDLKIGAERVVTYCNCCMSFNRGSTTSTYCLKFEVLMGGVRLRLMGDIDTYPDLTASTSVSGESLGYSVMSHLAIL